MLTGPGATFEDLYQALAAMTPAQRKCALTVELALSDEVLSSETIRGTDKHSHADVEFDIAGSGHPCLDDGHPVIVVQW